MMKVIRSLGVVNGPLFVTTANESVMLGEPARVVVHIGEDGPPLLELDAVVVKQQGADGDWYPAVVLRMKEGEGNGERRVSETGAKGS